MKEDITNINYKGKHNGCQKHLYMNNKIYYRGVVKNDRWIAYVEYHGGKETTYNIK